MGLLVVRHWTCIRMEHTRQIPNELQRADIRIKDRIEKLKPSIHATRLCRMTKSVAMILRVCDLNTYVISWMAMRRGMTWLGVATRVVYHREAFCEKGLCLHNTRRGPRKIACWLYTIHIGWCGGCRSWNVRHPRYSKFITCMRRFGAESCLPKFASHM